MTRIPEKIIRKIADEIESDRPGVVAVYAARYLITEYDRSALPDWIEALANANVNIWSDAVDEVRRLKEAEEVGDDGNDLDYQS